MAHYRNGRHIVVAMLFVVVVVGGGLLLRRCGKAPNAYDLSETERQELFAFSRSVRQRSYSDSLRRRKDYQRPEAEEFPFDPNTADSAALLRLGLRPWQIRNLMKYRRKGGRWRSPDDFARLYGLSKADYERLRPYICIAGGAKERCEPADTAATSAPRFPKIEKYAEGTVVDLNRADTTVLKKIPGIGSYYAGKICRYRESLGGFVAAEQIKEVEGLPEGVEWWFTVGTADRPRQMNVNQANFKQLVRHPYLNYEQVKIIFDYRRKYGRLKSWEDLRLYDEFPPAQIEKLRPYFTF